MKKLILLIGIVVIAFSCGDPNSNTQTTTVDNRNPSDGDAGSKNYNQQVRLELHISQKKLHVFRGDDTINTYIVAVGKSSHPTPTGEYKVHKIDWNPDWTPPDSEWSEDRTYKKPGQDGNPMGRARIIYQMPYTFHGTKDLESLGSAESHGSVRMANEDVIEFGKFLMRESGTERDNAWFDRVLGNPKEMVSVELNNPIPLVNKE